MVTKITISWDITPCSPSEVNRRFGGTHIASNFRIEELAEQETSVKVGGKQSFHACFLLG
jgi:hypothetical protein